MLDISTRIIFASDLHGSTLCFMTLLEEAITRKVGAVVIGGDLTGKFPTLIVRRPPFFEAMLGGAIRRVRESSLRELEEDIENSGSYAVFVGEQEYREIACSRSNIERILAEEGKRRVRDWLVTAEKLLAPRGIQFIMMPGNDDPWDIDDVISSFPSAENPDNSTVILRSNQTSCDHPMMGESTASKTPWNCPRDMEEPSIAVRIQKKISTIAPQDLSRAVFVCHCPPKETALDKAISTTASGEVITSGGHAVTIHVGSESVRRSIERHQPLLALHGHVHESDGFCKIGRTLCLNAGSQYTKGILQAWDVTLGRDEILDFQHFIR